MLLAELGLVNTRFKLTMQMNTKFSGQEIKIMKYHDHIFDWLIFSYGSVHAKIRRSNRRQSFWYCCNLSGGVALNV